MINVELFLIVDEEKVFTRSKNLCILGYFSILVKSLTLPSDMCGSKRRKLDGMDKKAEVMQCFLIGQFAKNYCYKDEINGSMILNRAIDYVRQAQV